MPKTIDLDNAPAGAIPAGFKAQAFAACIMAVGAANGGASAGLAEDAWTLYALLNDPETKARGLQEAQRLLQERDRQAA